MRAHRLRSRLRHLLAFGLALWCCLGGPIAASQPASRHPVSAALLSGAPLPPSPNATPLNAGKTLYEAGRYAEAVTLLERALAQPPATSLEQAALLSNLALCYQQLGAWTEAEQALKTSLTLLQTQSDTAARSVLAQSLDIQGRLRLAQGQPEAALAAWQTAAQAYRQLNDPVGEVRSQINQAQALQAAGFYRRALEVLTAANRALQPQPDSLTKATGLRSLGDALQRVGDLTQALAALQQSQTIAQRLNAPLEQSAALLSLGNLRRAQQPAAALKAYEQALALSPPLLLRTQVQLNQLSLLSATQRPIADLLPALEADLAQLPPSRAAVYARINLAQTLSAQSPPRLPTAAKLLAAARQQAQALGDRRSEAYATGSLGHLYEQTRQWDLAQTLTEQALLLAQAVAAPDITYRWEWQLGRLLKQQGQTARAIAAYERAVATLQSLRSDLVAINREVQFTFRDSVEPVYRQTVELLLQSQAVRPSEQTLDQARRLIESLQLAELDNFFREACLNAQSVLLDQVVDRDNPTAAILYPIILDNQLDLILKVPNQPLQHRSIPQPRATVERVLSRLRDTIAEPDTLRETQALAQQLYTWLIRPIEPALQQSGVNTLVFVLDGLLRNVPMASLYDGQQFLVEKYAVALSPSLQLFAPQPLAPTQLNALTAGLTTPPAQFEQFAPLPEVKSELSLIRAAGVATTQLLDQSFTSQALTDQINAAPYQVVHLATHGQFSSQANETFILAADGPINVSQLDRLLRSRGQSRTEAVELLVLSACETASGDNRATLGLAGVAIRAGARSTLASLWHIDDRSTALFIGEFYRELATAKVTKAEALRRAQIALLNNPNYRRPGYWAPYVLVGNWL